MACPTTESYNNLRVHVHATMSIANISDTLLLQIIFGFAWSISIPNDTFIGGITFFEGKLENQMNTTYKVTIDVTIQRPIGTHTEMFFQMDKIKNLKWSNQIRFSETGEDMTVSTDIFDFNKEYKYSSRMFWKFNKKGDLSRQMERLRLNSTVKPELYLCNKIDIESYFINQFLTINDITCLSYYTFSPETSGIDDIILVYMTYTGCSVSVISLILSIAVSRKYGVSKTIQGSNFENMSFSLIIANILFMIGIGEHDNQLICYIIGISLHYVWLTFFTFMTIAMLFLVYNVTKLRNTRNEKYSFSQKCCFTIIGLTIPVFFVGTAVALQYTEIEKHFIPKYDGSICFPTGYPANMIFFSGPVLLSLSINFACMVFLVSFIVSRKLHARNLRKVNSFKHVGVYLRISVITGIFWITGILSSVLQKEFLEFIFVITCSLHGFFIALANLTTKHIYRNMKQSFMSLSHHSGIPKTESNELSNKHFPKQSSTIEENRGSGGKMVTPTVCSMYTSCKPDPKEDSDHYEIEIRPIS